jgi:hypothetical protein
VQRDAKLTMRTAQLYMQIAERWAEIEAHAQRVASLRGAAKLLAEPRTNKPAGQSRSFTIARPEHFEKHEKALMNDHGFCTRGELIEWALEELYAQRQRHLITKQAA